MGEMVRGYHVRNVNEAFRLLVRDTIREPQEEVWKKQVSRGMETMEVDGPFITTYNRPCERVLFCPIRDANPFFHFFEALWILDGREDVEFLTMFNSKMKEFSDDGVIFNAPYGQRLRYSFGVDQLTKTIELLRAKPDTRQAVMVIWNPSIDLRVTTKDLPCNDMIMFKIRNGALRTTVVCRSNDALLGAYGANVVQFSVLHEFVARAVGVPPGQYIQMSDSFHIYAESEVLKRLVTQGTADEMLYEREAVAPYPLMKDDKWKEWLESLRYFMVAGYGRNYGGDPFWVEVAWPMMEAWYRYKQKEGHKNARIDSAIDVLEHQCKATDWRLACVNWLNRRRVAP